MATQVDPIFNLLFPVERREIDKISRGVRQLLQREQGTAIGTTVPQGTAQQAQQEQVVSVPSSIQPPSPTFPVPITPVALAESFLASHMPGISAPLFLGQSVTVPPYGVAQVDFNVVPNYVMIIMAPVRVYASLYTDLLLATILVDNVNLLIEEVPFAAPIIAEEAQYGEIMQSVNVTLINESENEIDVTYYVQFVLVRLDQYNAVWWPLLRGNYLLLAREAEQYLPLVSQ